MGRPVKTAAGLRVHETDDLAYVLNPGQQPRPFSEVLLQ